MSEKLERLAMNESGFLFDPQTGISYTTNITGLEIIRMVKDGKSAEEIQDEITSRYEVSPEEAERDIIDFLELMKSKGFVS
ncbi:MAG: PqqD family protein [bacterium]|jgi:hypothetical protein|nr:PqqD family protein [bacterium]